MHGVRFMFLAVIGVLLAACSDPDDRFGRPDDGFVPNTHKVVEDIEWSGAETVTVSLSEFGFSPDILHFSQGQPYILRLTNSGATSHRFVAHGFFRAIAARRLRYSNAEAGFPMLEAVALEPDETKMLYFVPMTPGDYELGCDRPFHAPLGMRGRILIQ